MQPGTFVMLASLLLFPASAVKADSTAPQSDDSTMQLSGTLDVVVEDDFHGKRSRLVHRLHDDATARSYRLDLGGVDVPELTSGAKVLVRGELRGDVFLADPAALEIVPGTDAMRGAGTAVEERRAIVLIVDFADREVPCSDTQITDRVFTGTQSVDDLYHESSFGALSLTHDTDGDGSPDVLRLTIAANTTDTCDKYGWAEAADTEAQALGIDLELYQHRIYVMPNWISCSWAGSANLGCGTSCRSWIRYCAWPDVFAHELGHNLSMSHASTDDDNDGTIDCSYCDTSDFMGYGGQGWRQVNGPHKYQMGWLPAEQVVEIDPGAAQTVVLSALEIEPLATAYPQLLRIPLDNGDYYYLSYRVATGYDQYMDPGYADRTSIHRSSTTGSGRSALVATLGDGGVFEQAGMSVTQISHDASTVMLLVEGDAPPTCIPVTWARPDGYFGSSVCQLWEAQSDPEESSTGQSLDPDRIDSKGSRVTRQVGRLQ
jgi:hypothetical protein